MMGIIKVKQTLHQQVAWLPFKTTSLSIDVVNDDTN